MLLNRMSLGQGTGPRHLTLCFAVVKFGKGNKTASLSSCGGGLCVFANAAEMCVFSNCSVSSSLTSIERSASVDGLRHAWWIGG